MIRIDFKYQVVADALKEASRRLDDMTPLHEDIADHVAEATKQRFKQGVDPDGVAWKPKSPVTLALYKARGDGLRPDPLIGPSKRLSTEIARFANAQGAEIGSSLEYSAVMQDGVKKGAFGRDSRNHPLPWGDIPARVWLGLSEADEAAIVDIADNYLEQAFDQRGFNG